MKEFLMLIRTEGDCADTMSPEFHKLHLQKVISYIADMQKAGKLISAQPLSMKGAILQGKTFKDGPFIESKEVVAGYFLFHAGDLNEAKEIAKAHPILEDEPSARIELREIKKEEGIN
jgi:hypothetical protein